MNIRMRQSVSTETGSPLTDGRSVAVLVSRIRIFASTCKDKTLVKKYRELNSVLEKLMRVWGFMQASDSLHNSSPAEPFVAGVPRSVLQVDGQFSHYVNPKGDFQDDWSNRRKSLWHTFESSIPDSVRDLLMSWRWHAELAAFERIKGELESAQRKVGLIEDRLKKEVKRSELSAIRVGFLDRIRIIRWSKRAREEEASIAEMEVLKQKKNAEVAERLADCERLAALIALESKTLLVDCGEYFATVFEEFTRSLDNEIKKELMGKFQQITAENENLKKALESHLRTKDATMHQLCEKLPKQSEDCGNDLLRRLNDAQQQIKNEFFYLNAFEIEQQDDARKRWKNAVENMRLLMRTTEESLLDGEHSH